VGELYFVGVGLADERDLSLRVVEELRACRTLFGEEYTATLDAGAWARLEALVGRPVRRLDRAEVEDPKAILGALNEPAQNPVAFLTAGDPFFATTHVALRLLAERGGHRWVYRPNASVLTAAPGFLGLMPYRFGRPVSLPFRDARFRPRSPFEGIAANRAAGLHTLVLLDLRPAEGLFLTAGEALAQFEEVDPDGAVFPSSTMLAVVARLGHPDAAAWVGDRAELQRTEFGPPLHALVVLAPTLHFEEEEAVARFRVGPTPR
jgi:diphthine synthase